MTEEGLIDLVQRRGLMVSWDEEGHSVREYIADSPIIFKLSDFFLKQCTPELITWMIDIYMFSPAFSLITLPVPPQEEKNAANTLKDRLSHLFNRKNL